MPYAADRTGGADAVLATGDSEQAIVSYDTATLSQRLVRTTPRSDAEYEQPDAIRTGGSLYFLDAELPLTTGSIPARLYRLALRASPRSAR